ncbi:DUF484 family protein [Stenotrophobium rhamnosiphilum]|uniref:DUF484 domain-containing protein n=1 Tax=Stenotrophobium rhamnosiphilum TaxID=2029166 RepID=A0A2T5MCR7_9GAMM|nr:DUF484 family protein [Stenotrophobium rhamnosiphilum]PTU30363.1 DUF484 domain-containing protein [Stenotrophobium rhamnosiphilum]
MAELKNKKSEKIEAPLLVDGQVVSFLKAHPDFLSRFPDLLETIEIKHSSGSAVSLIERQVDILRAKNQRLEDRLERLLDAARDNEKRSDHVHKLARTLIRAPSLAAVIAGLRQCMREDFGVDEVFVGLSPTAFKRHDIDGITVIETEGKIAKAYENFFRTRLTECGPISEARAKLLFAKAENMPQSAAIVPLEKEKNLGMLALGSKDPERFQPRQGKLFLDLTAELISAAVRARI